MKILRLDLIAYGPFTDTAIDLDAGAQGLHIVYGPNEAGKSSALRALRNLLYGIPERTPDAFQHPFAKMRIGAVLRSASGDVLEVVRRKGRGSTLRAADDKTAIEESALQRFLNGVDADLFATMFGIGYEELVPFTPWLYGLEWWLPVWGVPADVAVWLGPVIFAGLFVLLAGYLFLPATRRA